MSTRKFGRGTAALLAFMLTAASVAAAFSGSYTYAAPLPKLESIRVALFIDGRGTVPAVTLSSEAALSIGERLPDGVRGWFNVEPGKPARFSPDGYRLQVAETADMNAALSIYADIAAAGHPYIEVASVGSGKLYRVGLEGFRTAESARTAAAGLIGAYGSRAGFAVKGPHYASAGTFGSEAEAAERLRILAQNGIAADLAILPIEGGGVAWSVWIGGAADAAELERAKAAATGALSGLSVTAADTASPYLLKKTEVSGGVETVRYIFSLGMKLLAEAGGAAVKVHERFGRSYRGAVELTVYNGSLAVINELPFEDYLVSVVGSELGQGWPLEALKAQAVAARTYALSLGMKYRIAHISDSTADQAYKGIEAEFPAAAEAVRATRGEVLAGRDGLIVPYYSSNAGGMTAGADEVWKAPLDYAKSVSSPDEIAQSDKLVWYRIMLPDGSAGYVRSDFAVLTEELNAAGLPYVEVRGTDVNIRRAPYVDNGTNPPVAKANTGDRFVRIGEDIESNAYNWIRGPYSGEELARSLSGRTSSPLHGAVAELVITSRGPSGRVTGMTANGLDIATDSPDALRAALNGLPSTLFTVEETGKFTILGSAGRTRQHPASGGPLYAASAGGSGEMKLRQFYVMDGEGRVRAATIEPAFRFIGYGNGHGVGMSQYGARALAERGYDYEQILKYYYDGVSIVKE